MTLTKYPRLAALGTASALAAPEPRAAPPGSAGIGTSTLLLVPRPTLPGGIVSTTNCSLAPPTDATDVDHAQEEDKEHDEEDEEQDEAMAVDDNDDE